MEQEPLDVSFFRHSNSGWQTREAMATLQHLILIANRYLKHRQIERVKRSAKWSEKYCPVLICLIFCCGKNMMAFDKRWEYKFNPENFFSNCCPENRANTICGRFLISSYGQLNFEPSVDGQG